jgi:GT2 family glycosyltransferase
MNGYVKGSLALFPRALSNIRARQAIDATDSEVFLDGRSKPTGSSHKPLARIHRQPGLIHDHTGKGYPTFIETLAIEHGSAFLIGWSAASNLEIEHPQCGAARLFRHGRNDVAQALGHQSEQEFGFVAVVDDISEAEAYEFAFRVSDGPDHLTEGLNPRNLEPHQREVIDSIIDANEAPPDTHGYLEGIFVSPLPSAGAIAFGWALHPPGEALWLEDAAGNAYGMEKSFRRIRTDVGAAFPDNPWREQPSGFILYLPELTMEGAEKLRLRIRTSQGQVTLTQTESAQAERLPLSPKAAAEKLFSIETEDYLFHERVAKADWPILEPLIAHAAVSVRDVPATRRDFGKVQANPAVSVIVPLYRRFDFMEHQILEFGRDSYFRENCELIYVVDDPEIDRPVIATAEFHHKLFGLSFSVISGQRNRGFSGANNLGAEYAQGRELLFMNSDVIPREPGWLAPMRDLLASDERIGIVGPRLLFASGGLQHAGMAFGRSDHLGIWINRHPFVGLSPDLDPAVGPQDVPAVTGACMLMSRATFDAVDGWNTGYLIGDFEDSDLCLTVRSAGYRVVYQPESQLTHLERQSFTNIGEDSFRQHLVIANAVRHEARWRAELEAYASGEKLAEQTASMA